MFMCVFISKLIVILYVHVWAVFHVIVNIKPVNRQLFYSN